MTTQTIAASPAKLKDGSWGARIARTDVAPGQVVTIRTQAGKTWDARITRVVWTGDGIALCATESADRPARTGQVYVRDAFNGYGRPRGGFRRACKTDGNCSSFGSGRSCGGEDCDGF